MRCRFSHLIDVVFCFRLGKFEYLLVFYDQRKVVYHDQIFQPLIITALPYACNHDLYVAC
jgi:hypothetical protein